MKILIIGETENLQEVKDKFGEVHSYTLNDLDVEDLEDFDIIFDFLIEENPEQFDMYKDFQNCPVFLNTVKISLAELVYNYGSPTGRIFGFNGLPTFFDRSLLEVSSLEKDPEQLKEICKRLSTNYQLVGDRVGMVTPRIVFMIINEAFYTVQEGTASRKDIDLGMKLGTNYPYGPFEWTEKIGIHHVYETLEAIYEDTREERYKICPLLKKEYLLSDTNEA